jgi:hypothetical protein
LEELNAQPPSDRAPAPPAPAVPPGR